MSSQCVCVRVGINIPCAMPMARICICYVCVVVCCYLGLCVYIMCMLCVSLHDDDGKDVH